LLLGPQLGAFAAAGYEVIGVSAPGPFVGQLRAAGIDHVALRHATRSMSPAHDAAALVELTGLFRRLRPDIVHTHNPKPGVYGRLAAAAAGVPVVVNTVHGLYATPDDRLARRAVVYGLERLAATCSDTELVQNPEDVAVLARLGVPADKITLLGNGIDLARFHPDPADREAVRAELGYEPGDVVVGVVGRLVWEKGYREVFAAAAALHARRPGVRFVVAGPADDAKDDALGEPDIAAPTRYTFAIPSASSLRGRPIGATNPAEPCSRASRPNRLTHSGRTPNSSASSPALADLLGYLYLDEARLDLFGTGK